MPQIFSFSTFPPTEYDTYLWAAFSLSESVFQFLQSKTNMNCNRAFFKHITTWLTDTLTLKELHTLKNGMELRSVATSTERIFNQSRGTITKRLAQGFAKLTPSFLFAKSRVFEAKMSSFTPIMSFFVSSSFWRSSASFCISWTCDLCSSRVAWTAALSCTLDCKV